MAGNDDHLTTATNDPSGKTSAWVAIHMARSEQAANDARDALTAEGFLVRIHPVFRGVSAQENMYEIQVLRGEMREARAVLMERGIS